MEISRRNLFKWAGFLGAGLALPKVVKAKVLTPKEKPLPYLDSEVYKPAVCKLCPALCMLQIRVVNGSPVGVAGMQGHPISQGAHCPKGGAILQDLYHPDRLRSPMRQTGPRDSGQWERISWDEAHQILHDKLFDLIRRGKPEALAMLAAPIRDIRHEIQKRFAQIFGTSNFWEWNWPLATGPLDAFKTMHGTSEGLFYDLANANLVVSFGWDWLQSFLSPVEAQRAFSLLRRARLERRTRMIQIEPRLSVTASKADEWISIKPDTEGVLALGVAHVLIQENLYDKNFIVQWASGFEEFKKLVLKEYEPQKVSEIVGIKTDQIFQIAHEMASIRPALAITCRTSRFNQIAVHSLNALVGSIGVKRGILATEAEKYQLTLPPLSIPKPKTEPIASLDGIPEAILAPSSSPIEILWMERVNPVFLSPQPAQWKKVMEKIPFIISFSSFLDESSQMADIVLPPHHSLEAWQYGFSPTLEGHGVISFAPPVIDPIYNTGDHGDFILGLAKSLGQRFASAFPWETFVESLQKAVKKAGADEPMKKGGWWEYQAEIANIASTIKTGSKKIKLASEALTSVVEGAQDPSHPLRLYIHVPMAYSFGEGAHLPYLHSLAGAHLGEQWETWVEIHPYTAKRLGIADKQEIWVESLAAKIKARARLYEGIREDTVSVPFGLGHTALGRYARGIGSNPGELLSSEMDVSGQIAWQRARVKVYGA
ncbi:MAG: molybdopterin-dependent oxidoreductase [Elusimicrobia bacterium]|nr:molybdopterin-dependent oxidoreductase [Elusimicrobiota bacterium]